MLGGQKMSRKKILGTNMSQKAFRNAFDVKISDKATLKIQAALDEELSRIRNASPKPIMIEEHLDDIPCFEFGGKLLFRKEAVDEWIRSREKNYAVEVMDFNLRNSLKITIA
jgi:hypothetical protein